MTNRPIRYGIMSFEEHPYARMMLQVILAKELPPPSLVVHEVSPVAGERCGWYRRILKNAGLMPKSVRDQLQDVGVQHPRIFDVDDMNGVESIAAIR